MMKQLIKIVFLMVSFQMSIVHFSMAQGDRFVCDESCDPSSSGVAKFNVVSPVGFSTMEQIEMSPRLETLDGKTIAIVGEDFMYNVTHPELKRLILANYPTAKIIMYDELPIAGPYPAPGITRQATEEFRQRLIDLKVDAVIAGNGGCGICTPKETGSCIVAEKLGIPSVIVTAPGFDQQARYTARNNGVPVMRVAVYPGAFASHTDEQLIQNTREVTWPQIVEALTTPIRQDEYAEAGSIQGITDDVYHGTIEEVYAYFRTMGWSDGMPFRPPVYDKVLEYLDYTDHSWDETIAVLPGAFRNTTTWHVAVNACMSGCKPEYMPILVAMTKAMAGGDFRRTLGSTHAWVPYSWLNGPVARQLGISSGQGEINAEANVTISRFMALALQNLAGYSVGQNRMGTFGYLQPWCLVEDEEACHRVGWQTWNEQQGYGINDNTVTLASALMWGNNMAPSTIDPERVMQLMAWDISERCQFALGSGKQFTNRVILMTEPVADILAGGYPTIDALEDALILHSRRPAYERAFANYYANAGGRKDGGEHTFNQYLSHIVSSEGGEETATPVWYDTDAATMTTVPTMEKGATAFLVTGDASRNKVQCMPGGGFSTVSIDLPADWDALMAEKGYPALTDMYITTTSGDDGDDPNDDQTGTRTVLDENSTTLPTAATDVDVRVKRTINAGEWSTICLPFAMTAPQVTMAFGNGVELGNFTGYETVKGSEDDVVGITANFENVTVIEANHPYIIKVPTEINEFTVDEVTIAPKEKPRVALGSITGSDAQAVYHPMDFVGTFVADFDFYHDALVRALFLSGNKFYYATENSRHMKAFRAYFDFDDVLSSVTTTGSRIAISFPDDDSTGVEERDNRLGDGRASVYDLQGRCLDAVSRFEANGIRSKSRLSKGLYIVNGKKVVIK